LDRVVDKYRVKEGWMNWTCQTYMCVVQTGGERVEGGERAWKRVTNKVTNSRLVLQAGKGGDATCPETSENRRKKNCKIQALRRKRGGMKRLNKCWKKSMEESEEKSENLTRIMFTRSGGVG